MFRGNRPNGQSSTYENMLELYEQMNENRWKWANLVEKDTSETKKSKKVEMSTAPTREHQNQGPEGTNQHSEIMKISKKSTTISSRNAVQKQTLNL